MSSRFRGAFKSHFTAWSVVWDVLCSVAAVYLIHRNLPHWLDRGDAPQNMALYLSLAALAMGCLVSYRRANGLDVYKRQLLEWADAIARFAEDGGVWVETGGYPLFYRMAPVRTLRFEVPYPAGFSDFQHLETEAGSLSWYRVAPRQLSLIHI